MSGNGKDIIAGDRRIEFEIDLRGEGERRFERVEVYLNGSQGFQGFEAREVSAVEVLDLRRCGDLLRRVGKLW